MRVSSASSRLCELGWLGVGEEVAGGGFLCLGTDAAARRTETESVRRPRRPDVPIWAIRVVGEGPGRQTWENPPMRRSEGVFSSMTYSNRHGFMRFVVDAGDEAHYMLGVTRLCRT